MDSLHNGLHILALCAGNPPVTGGFPAQQASNAERLSMSACVIVMPNLQFDGLVQERGNPIANALELRLSVTNPST